MTIKKYGQRYFAVYDDDGELVCVTVYKKGAREVVRRLAALIPSPTGPSSPGDRRNRTRPQPDRARNASAWNPFASVTALSCNGLQ